MGDMREDMEVLDYIFGKDDPEEYRKALKELDLEEKETK